jgi:hypothetical protein
MREDVATGRVQYSAEGHTTFRGPILATRASQMSIEIKIDMKQYNNTHNSSFVILHSAKHFTPLTSRHPRLSYAHLTAISDDDLHPL